MTNPFATAPASTPDTATSAPNPFTGSAAPAPEPAATPAATPPPAATATDPFATPPPAPEVEFEGINSDDAAGAGTVVVLKIKNHEENVPSNFKDDKGNIVYQNKLTVDVFVITGPKAGKFYADQWLFWKNVCGQFAGCAGDGNTYLVRLKKVGRAVVTEQVTDEATKAEARRLMGL